MSVARLRHVSASVFGNEKVVEVVTALRRASGIATAQQIAKATGIDHPMVRAVLLRLTEASILTALPRAGARSAQYYQADTTDPVWDALCSLVEALERQMSSTEAGPFGWPTV